jgi:hypothetical protein
MAYVACPYLPCRYNSVSRKKTYVQSLALAAVTYAIGSGAAFWFIRRLAGLVT